MMIKLTIKKLEKNLGYKIKKNTYCCGVDLASTTGIAIVNVNNKLVKIETAILKISSIPRKLKDQMAKAEKYEKAMEGLLTQIREFKPNIRLKISSILVLEQSFLLRIGKKVINPQTFGYLRCCQGIFYSEFYDLFPTIKIWLATVARKLVGFKSLLPKGTKTPDKKKEIMKWVSNVVEKEITDDNIADALILAFAGLKEV